MFKRILMSLTFLAAFGLVGVWTPDTSEARRYWRRPLVRRYYAPPSYYYYDRPFFGPRYRTYYGAPRYYDYYYGYPDYYGPRGGIYFSW